MESRMTAALTELHNLAALASIRGHFPGTTGNISFEMAGTHLITQTDRPMVLMERDGLVESRSTFASKEAKWHRNVLAYMRRNNVEAQVLIHAHSKHIFDYVTSDEYFLAKREPEQRVFENATVKFVRVGEQFLRQKQTLTHLERFKPGSDTLANAIFSAVEDIGKPAFAFLFLQGHGVVVYGRSPVEAFHRLDVIELACRDAMRLV